MIKLILNRKIGLKNGRLPGMNEYTTANRGGYHTGNAMKKRYQTIVAYAIKQQRIPKAIGPVVVHFRFYEPNRRRDLDNISGFAHKVILDALVNRNIIRGDGWRYVRGYSDAFFCDAENPRIEIYIEEVE